MVCTSPAAFAVGAIDHILRKIAGYCDRRTLGTLMRVNLDCYSYASGPLYDCVWAHEDNIDSLMTGALHMCNCKVCKSNPRFERGCKCHNCEKFGKSSPHATNTSKKQTANTPKKQTATKSKIKGRNNKKKYKAKAAPQAKNSKATRVETEEEVSEDDATPRQASNRECKPSLLSRIRVFTIGSHDDTACHGYAHIIAKLAKDVQVVRLFEVPFTGSDTYGLCGHDICPFLKLLEPSKLVIRNCSARYVPFPPAFDWKLSPKTTEVVLFYPPYRDRWAGPGKVGTGPSLFIKSMMGQFWTARHIKIVFHDWDFDTAPQLMKEKDHIDKNTPLYAEDTADILKHSTYAVIDPEAALRLAHRKPQVTIYGFGSLKLEFASNESPLLKKYLDRHGGKMPAAGAHIVIKEHVMGMEILFAQGMTSGGLLGSCEKIWKAKDVYMNKTSRVAEINEWD